MSIEDMGTVQCECRKSFYGSKIVVDGKRANDSCSITRNYYCRSGGRIKMMLLGIMAVEEYSRACCKRQVDYGEIPVSLSNPGSSNHVSCHRTHSD